ncbi:hypothetical protein [Streptomyces sp. NPDC001970]
MHDLLRQKRQVLQDRGGPFQRYAFPDGLQGPGLEGVEPALPTEFAEHLAEVGPRPWQIADLGS